MHVTHKMYSQRKIQNSSKQINKMNMLNIVYLHFLKGNTKTGEFLESVQH